MDSITNILLDYEKLNFKDCQTLTTVWEQEILERKLNAKGSLKYWQIDEIESLGPEPRRNAGNYLHFFLGRYLLPERNSRQ